MEENINTQGIGKRIGRHSHLTIWRHKTNMKKVTDLREGLILGDNHLFLEVK